MSDYDKEVLTASAQLSRLDAIEKCLINVEKSEALVKWENLYTRLWNIEARLDKLEEDRHGTAQISISNHPNIKVRGS